jgi:predicted nucleic acid-binding protein
LNVYFFDSSALVKRYVTETGTSWVSALVDPSGGNRIFIVSITAVEVVSAIKRRERAGNLSPADMTASLTKFRHELSSIYLPIEISRNLISRAMSLVERHALRGYDAVQLASALEVYDQRQSAGMTGPIFVSADADLNSAAATEGLAVDDPNGH